MDQETLRKKFDKTLQSILSDPMAKRNLLTYTWQVGSTTVHPVTVWSCDMELQWHSRRPCHKWIAKIVEKHNDLFRAGRYVPNDDSCPPVIRFEFTDALASALSERRKK